ncbi:C39 family peptidase [Ectobacillus antri]|uniref:C39 family peptidase n=1 Tax=Ectobacillus antri TaxID=2486280 RepID=A0ABT6H579_9BACI|nr:C39 family peptidase [Ectobacillus antri]MDG4656893.1 C39 family peptidase [Ectobacillus antri]MDG5754210.1 C39 family peptidase [Ectobacillus antri]
MLQIVKNHKKKVLLSLPVLAAISYYGWKKRYHHTVLIHAPHIEQNPELPRGCEVTSLAMLLCHAGIDVDKMELASKIDKVAFEEHNLHGNMQEGFVGDMYSFSRPGLGVYIEPIYKLAFSYLHTVNNLTGGDPEDLYRKLDQGVPVWTIVNDTFAPLPDERFETWFTNEGPMHVTYAMHSVLLTGYSRQYVYINDPLYHMPNKRIKRSQFEQTWIQMGRQALSYQKQETRRSTTHKIDDYVAN